MATPRASVRTKTPSAKARPTAPTPPPSHQPRRRVVYETQATQAITQVPSKLAAAALTQLIESDPPEPEPIEDEDPLPDTDSELQEEVVGEGGVLPEDLEPPSSPCVSLEDVKYDLQARLIYKKEELGSRMWLMGGWDDLYSKATVLAASKKGYSIERVTVNLSYAGCRKTDMKYTDINGLKEWTDFQVPDILLAWLRALKTGLRIDMVVRVIKEVTATEQQQPPPATQRATATTRQEAASAATREVLESRGDFSVGIRTQWTCSQRDCRNFDMGGCCYWLHSDSAADHYPLENTTLRQWSADIKDGRTTAGAPTLTVFSQLIRDCEKGKKRSHKRRRSEAEARVAPQMPPLQQFFGAFPLQWGLNGPSGAPAGQFFTAAPQLDLPSSQPTETGPKELYEEFFLWAYNEPSWKGYTDDLKDIDGRLESEGYDLDTALRISAIDWRGDLHLRRGLQEKWNSSVRRWLSKRRR